MPNLLLKLLDQWIDSIALPPESRGRFSAPAGRTATATVAAPAQVASEAPVVDRTTASPESQPDATEAPGLLAKSRPPAADRPGVSAEPALPVAEALPAPDVPLTSRMAPEVLPPTPRSVPDALHGAAQPEPDVFHKQASPALEADSTDDILSEFNWD